MTRRAGIPGLLLLSATVCLAACGDDVPTRCSDPVSVHVSGSPPKISWTPACGMSSLSVFRDTATDPRPPVWWVEAYATPFGPPIRYGDRPAVSQEMIPPEALVSGKAYKVFLTAFLRAGPVDSAGFIAP
jgi:hypothetical protein